VTLPNSVTSIGSGAFAFCGGLMPIKVAADNPHFISVDGVLFNKDKTALIHYPRSRAGPYVIPDGVTSIGYRTFALCDSLTSVTIPNSVTSIGKEAFYDCGNLTSVTIDNGVTTIEELAFAACGVTSITIPNSVTHIGNSAFSGCYNLTSAVIPDSVTHIGDYAFSHCRSLKSVTIPNGVTSIEQGICDVRPEVRDNPQQRYVHRKRRV